MERTEMGKYLRALPVCFILGVFPLIICRLYVRTYTEEVTWLPSLAIESDFFLYGKVIALYTCVIGIMILMLLCYIPGLKRVNLRGVSFPTSTFLLIAYAGLVILSAIASEHTFLSFRGMSSMMQGAGVLCCYLIVFFYSLWWSKMQKEIRSAVIALAICITIIGVIGLSQLFDFDLLSMGPVKYFLGGRNSRVKHLIYLTLYHWNYVGSYVALVLPITIAMIFYFEKKGRKRARNFWIILFYLLVICLCGSQSRTGAIGIAGALGVGLFVYRRKVRCRWKPILRISISVVLIALFCNVYITGSMIGKWNQVTFKTKGSKKLSYMITGEKSVKIKYREEILELKIIGSGKNIHIDPGKKKNIPKGLSFEKKKIQDGENQIYGYEMKYKKSRWIFTNQHGDGSYYYLNPCGKFDKITKADTALPPWMNEFASLRGFVWSRTVPLLKEYIILGAGADQFGFVFPHQDYTARYQYDLLTTYYKKPHNWYLQMATESGCVSAVLMIVFWILYLVRGFRQLSDCRETLADYLQCAIWFSVLGYLLTAFFNDSFLTVAPVFWCLAGVGMGLQRSVSN